MYWIFGGIKIPKGLDPTIKLFSAFTDEVVDKIARDDPVEGGRMLKALIDAAPSISATVFTPAVETMANYSFFREAPIVPSREQHLPAEYQYSADTTLISKNVGKAIGYSPRKLDYLINGYFGFMGRFASQIPDYWFGNKDLTTSTESLSELPIIRRFVFNPYKNPKIVKDYYTEYNRQDELYNGYLLERREGKNPTLPKDYDSALHRRLKASEETMRNISKAEKKIMDDMRLDTEQRQKKLRELEKRRIAICEKIFRKSQ